MLALIFWVSGRRRCMSLMLQRARDAGRYNKHNLQESCIPREPAAVDSARAAAVYARARASGFISGGAAAIPPSAPATRRTASPPAVAAATGESRRRQAHAAAGAPRCCTRCAGPEYRWSNHAYDGRGGARSLPAPAAALCSYWPPLPHSRATLRRHQRLACSLARLVVSSEPLTYRARSWHGCSTRTGNPRR